MEKAANYIKENNEKIINIWEENVNSEIEVAKGTESLVLRNQLSHILNDIMKIMDRYDNFEQVKQGEKFEEIISNSMGHGRHRASTSNYAIKQILQEYMIFHRTLVELIRDAGAYNEEVGNILNYAVETAMIYSADSFSKSLQKMRERLVGTLAHDLRNPLATAYLAIDHIDCEDDPERVHYLKKMGKKSMKNSLQLIEGLLDAITVKAGEGITMHFTKTNLIEDIEWVYEESREIYSNKIILDVREKQIDGIFDGAAVRRILENLISNAVKYGEKKSPIRITVLDIGKEVAIKIHNTGNPIPKEKQEEVFKFMNTKDGGNQQSAKSWGMGLYLVRIVAEAHGGKVSLTSNEKEGTTFEVILRKDANEPGVHKTRLESQA
ncbi:sensor histidine kinase [Salinimicrobium sp. HB62]|uniref:sensor histidine kinase n=1 Tax=Salinimicrobium sp. HB62 TaxID=3077781 RepID=UPI002D79EC4D|nr:HAMP domain-containing sensor histidine kinase [Salinimicrobium sp. HB62]